MAVLQAAQVHQGGDAVIRVLRRTAIAIAIIFVFAVFPLPATDSASGAEVRDLASCPVHAVSAGSNHVNITEIWKSVWSRASADELQTMTRLISQEHPNRLENTFDMTPSIELEGAISWASERLNSITGGTLTFRKATDYGVLYALKNGTGTGPHSVFVISGIIDSELSPGANDVGISVAAVLEMARVLNEYSLPFDIMYVLSTAGRTDPDYDPAARAFVSWLEEQGFGVLMTVSFDRMLYHREGYPYGTQLSLRSQAGMDYRTASWMPDLLSIISNTMGNGFLKGVSDLERAERSIAREMWLVNQPGVHIAQGYWPDRYSGTEDDVWYTEDYSYVKAREAVASVACAILYMAATGDGDSIAHYRTGLLEPGRSVTVNVPQDFCGYLNVTVTWNNSEPMYGEIIYEPDSTTVYRRNESDEVLIMKYLVHDPGMYEIRILYQGDTNATYSLEVTYLSDTDGDTISDFDEVRLGIDPYMTDSDRDGLADNLELLVGSNALSNDTDDDGASDYDEYIGGSNPLLNDTDGDGLVDGIEMSLGTSSTDYDTDDDGLSDLAEVMTYGTNPRQRDTDADGLFDGLEVSMGLNPLSSDSDGDSLSDLFEVLNGLNATSPDTDGDGWGDAYEVEFCMRPDSPDTDGDGIPDSIDWDPQVHWVAMVAPVGVLTLVSLIGIFTVLKYRHYRRGE